MNSMQGKCTFWLPPSTPYHKEVAIHVSIKVSKQKIEFWSSCIRIEEGQNWQYLTGMSRKDVPSYREYKWGDISCKWLIICVVHSNQLHNTCIVDPFTWNLLFVRPWSLCILLLNQYKWTLIVRTSVIWDHKIGDFGVVLNERDYCNRPNDNAHQ